MNAIDWWLWGEYADGSPLLPGATLSADTDTFLFVRELFEDYEGIVCVREWKQYETWKGLQGPVNVLIRTWDRTWERNL